MKIHYAKYENAMNKYYRQVTQLSEIYRHEW